MSDETRGSSAASAAVSDSSEAMAEFTASIAPPSPERPQYAPSLAWASASDFNSGEFRHKLVVFVERGVYLIDAGEREARLFELCGGGLRGFANAGKFCCCSLFGVESFDVGRFCACNRIACPCVEHGGVVCGLQEVLVLVLAA